MLQHAFNHQEWLTDHRGALPVVEIGPDDDIRDPGFIFEREEDEALCRSRPLPRNDHARDAHAPAVACARQVGGAQHAAQRQLTAPQRHRMRTDRQAHPRVIGLQALAGVHGSQRRTRTSTLGSRRLSTPDSRHSMFSASSWFGSKFASSESIIPVRETIRPAGRTARSTCQSALRRSLVNALSAPISASVVSSSRRRPVRCTTSSIERKRPAGRSSTVHSCEQMLQ